MNKNKKWCMLLCGFTMLTLIPIAAITIIIDPFFHYHKPLEQFEYPLEDDCQVYINDGVLKHFEYDALIIGSSMTENFKTSQLDELFGVNSVKTCFSGNTYHIINTNVQTAIREQDDLRMVVTCLDVSRLCDESNFVREDMGEYPTYMYDNNIFNDVSYVLNKEILLEKTYNVVKYTKEGNETTSFDEYCNWMDEYIFDAEEILLRYKRMERVTPDIKGQEAQRANIEGNISQNIVALAKENPQVEFYIFFPPYSICYWDNMDRYGCVEWQIGNIEIATELILECENVHIYAFYDEYEMICDLNNYRDMVHYSESVNEQILAWMANGEHEITKENCEKYFEDIKQFYCNYDYDELFEK